MVEVGFRACIAVVQTSFQLLSFQLGWWCGDVGVRGLTLCCAVLCCAVLCYGVVRRVRNLNDRINSAILASTDVFGDLKAFSASTFIGYRSGTVPV